jgi:hypothetical protein
MPAEEAQPEQRAAQKGSHQTPRWRRQSGANSSLNTKFPVIQGKYREFHRRRPSQLRIGGRNSYHNQVLTRKFPTQWNRELIGPYQGIKSAHQGMFPSEQGSPSLGLSFLTIWYGAERQLNASELIQINDGGAAPPAARRRVRGAWSPAHPTPYRRRGVTSQTTYASP